MKTSHITIRRDLSETQREEVAQILYDSFNAKLIHVWYHQKSRRETIGKRDEHVIGLEQVS